MPACCLAIALLPAAPQQPAPGTHCPLPVACTPGPPLAPPHSAALAQPLARRAPPLLPLLLLFLRYRDRILDGFYEVHGDFPEVCGHAEFPHLAPLVKARRARCLLAPLPAARCCCCCLLRMRMRLRLRMRRRLPPCHAPPRLQPLLAWAPACRCIRLWAWATPQLAGSGLSHVPPARPLQLVPKQDPDVSMQRREVVLVDRRYDKQLAAIRQEAAQAVARAHATSSRSSDGGSGVQPPSPGSLGSPSRSRRSDSPDAAAARAGPPDSLACFQALAAVVAGHMGGSLVRPGPAGAAATDAGSAAAAAAVAALLAAAVLASIVQRLTPACVLPSPALLLPRRRTRSLLLRSSGAR